MLIFIFIITSYSAANIYFYTKLTAIVNSGATDVVTGAVILLLALGPVIIPVYSHRGSEQTMRILSYVGYMWLAFLVLFFPAGLILDAYNIAVARSGLFSGSETIVREKVFFIPLLLSIGINIYGFFEARRPRIERLIMHTRKLPDEVERVRIAQISDLHLSVTVGEKMVKRVIKKIEYEAPDIIVSTGDLIDGIVRHVSHLSAPMRQLRSRHGKFAVTGNHEFYGGLRHTVKFIEDSGFTVLQDKGITVKGVINIAGMDFAGGETIGYRTGEERKKERDILTALPSGLFTLLLKHRSDVDRESLGLFDLQLSGHSHKGQIFPVNLATMFLFSYHTGFTRLPKGSAIYTSRGTGTAGPPVRFLSTPEITIIDIVRDQ